MIIVPSTAVETMGLGALGGLTAFDREMGGAVPKSVASDGSASKPAADTIPPPGDESE
jgi:hypothetical protein